MRMTALLLPALFLPLAALAGPASAGDATERCTNTLLALQEALSNAAPAHMAGIVGPALVDVQAHCEADADAVSQEGVSKLKGVLALTTTSTSCTAGNKWVQQDPAPISGAITLFGVTYPVPDGGPATAGRDAVNQITYTAQGAKVGLTASNYGVGTVSFFGVRLAATATWATLGCRFSDPSQGCEADGYSHYRTEGLTLSVRSSIDGWCV